MLGSLLCRSSAVGDAHFDDFSSWSERVEIRVFQIGHSTKKNGQRVLFVSRCSVCLLFKIYVASRAVVLIEFSDFLQQLIQSPFARTRTKEVLKAVPGH